MFKFLAGILLAVIAVAIFLYFRGINIWPPVEASFRASKIPFSKGQVLKVTNTSGGSEITGSIKVFSLKEKKELFSRQLQLAPGESCETGHLEGWSFSPGEKVVIDIAGYVLPQYINVP